MMMRMMKPYVLMATMMMVMTMTRLMDDGDEQTMMVIMCDDWRDCCPLPLTAVAVAAVAAVPAVNAALSAVPAAARLLNARLDSLAGRRAGAGLRGAYTCAPTCLPTCSPACLPHTCAPERLHHTHTCTRAPFLRAHGCLPATHANACVCTCQHVMHVHPRQNKHTPTGTKTMFCRSSLS